MVGEQSGQMVDVGMLGIVEVEVGEAISGERSQRALRTWDKVQK